MDVIILIGRIIFAYIFLAGAAGHLTATADMAALISSRGVPAARAVVLGTGVMLLVAAALIILGAWTDLAALLLVIFLVPTAVVVHAFWKESDPQARLMEQLHFNKDISLAGGALILLGFTLLFGDQTGLFLTDPLLPALTQ